MKTIITGWLLILTLCITYAQTETRSIDTYKGINVSGSISIEIRKATVSKAEITVLKGDINQLMTTVSGGILDVRFVKSDSDSWGGGAKANIVLYTQSLNAISASAGATIESDDIWDTKTLDLIASSGARIAIATTTNKCKAESSSGAKVTVKGTSNSLTTSSSSGASIYALGLIANTVKASASSGGSVQVNVTESIKASATAGGTINYKGNPTQQEINNDKHSGGMIKQIL